jgi:hypothetical protein
MSKNLAAASARAAPPPFWKQLPQVFTYPAHIDALVKIVAYAIGIAIAVNFLPLGWLWAILMWLAFLAYCFGILERTARGHLVAADYINDRVNRDYRPIKQIVLFVILLLAAGMVGAFAGPMAGQVALLVACLVLPAAIMVLALDEQLLPALNPLRLLATIAGIGLPYLALCAFLFLLLESAQFLGGLLESILGDWMSDLLASVITMYFMVSMYYLMGYALYQNHEALGVDVQVDPAAAQRNLAQGQGKREPELLGPETQALITEGKLGEAVGRIENRMRKEWDNNKLHDQYQKLLLLDGKPVPITRHVNEYVPKLIREKKTARAVEVYEAAKKKVPDLVLTDATLLLPLATQASELHRDATAVELLKGFDKRFPGHDDIPGVYMLAAKIMLEKQHQYALAQRIFQTITQKFPKHPLAAEAAKLGELAGKMAAQTPPG